ncbi:MAG TPA: hypothetical protein VMV93_09690 [Chloroflexota bacterium]|nr:hypothetical protein [Chloroflexota bacterium]
MSNIVLGIGTSHTPQISTAWPEWGNLGKTEQVSPAVPADLEAQLQPSVWEERHGCVQRAVKQLGEKLRSAKLDAIVIFGDDQHEQFNDGNMPAVAIYHGERAEVHAGQNRRMGSSFPELHFESTAPDYPNDVELAGYLIEALTEREFEVTRCNTLTAPRGIGHAFSFLYQRLWAECDVPIVPVMVNTYYPPNQPTPKRCWNLGEAVRDAVAGWGGDKRIGVIASGGLSHIVIDEPLDHQVIDALQTKDVPALWALPREKMRGGTSEILNWVACAGAVQALNMTLVDYIPGYRSRPSTGCAMAFAYWD